MGVVSPRAGVLLEGPAAAFVESEGVRVTQGRVHVVAAEASLEVSSAYARTRGVRAAWTMDVDAERTRVVVLSGVVEIVGDGEAERLSAGASVVCDARGVHRVPASPARRSLLHEDGPPARTAPPETPADDVDGRLSDALRALRAGDRAHAEEALTAFLAVAALGDARRAYATFRLAELELARRDVADARPRLLALVNGADSALAEDAATLLASSYPAPSRAEAWASYAGVAPSGSRRARARLEEARARAAAGDAPGARRAAHAACAEDAVDVCREAERLGLVH